MSQETFKSFMKKVEHDEGLKQELRAAGCETGIALGTLVTIAGGKGYVFKAEDVSNEVSDQQLDSVSGGAYEFYVKLERPGTRFSFNDKLTIKW